jgi:allophanate hydrolase
MSLKLPQALTVAHLHELYATGVATPSEVIDAVLARCERYGDYHIWIDLFDRARIDSYLKGLGAFEPGVLQRCPLWGIPFAIKDNIDLAGVPTTAACPAYAYTPDQSATVVARILDAGAIPVGKTNLDQFATGLVGTRSPYGECHNALRPELISGGSSSGSAVSVALGLVAFALGTDTAGSGRVPAALNDIIGFKPPLGSWSTRGVVPACASLDCVTVFAQTLKDAAAVDAVASAFDPNCAWSSTRVCAKDPQVTTIYIPSSPPEFFGDFADEYRVSWLAFLERAKEVASQQDLRIEDLDTQPLSRIAAILYEGPWVAERWSDLGGFIQAHPDALLPVTKGIIEGGASPRHTAAQLFTSLHQVAAARQQMARLLQDAVLIMPTTGGTFTRADVRKDPVATNAQLGLYTNHCNLCDLSALAIPADAAGQKLPFGITIFAAPDAQQNLFMVAHELLRTGKA